MTLAERALRDVIRLRTARGVVIRDARAFEALVAELKKALVNTFSDAMRRGIVVALDRLRDLGPGAFTQGDGDTILRALEREVGAEALTAAMREPTVNLGESLYRLGLAEVGQSAGVSLAFMRPDQDALDVLARANNFWIGDAWQTGPRNKVVALLDEYFTTGLTREALARRLAEDFAGVSENTLHHWRSVANALATRTREIGRVSAYERAGIEAIQIKAILDDTTTTVCRHLHGRVIPVPVLRGQAEAWMEASTKGNKPASFKAWRFHGDDDDLSATPTADLRGVGMPPYHHGNCRTVTVAYFGDVAGDLGRWQRAMQDREALPKAEIAKIIDRAKGAIWAEGADGGVARRHFADHASRLGVKTLTGYNDSIADNIRRAGREVWLYQRNGAIRALFVRKHRRVTSKGKTVDGLLTTAIDLAGNRVVSHHFREKLGLEKDEIAPVKQGGLGIVKGVLAWLTN